MSYLAHVTFTDTGTGLALDPATLTVLTAYRDHDNYDPTAPIAHLNNGWLQPGAGSGVSGDGLAYDFLFASAPTVITPGIFVRGYLPMFWDDGVWTADPALGDAAITLPDDTEVSFAITLTPLTLTTVSDIVVNATPPELYAIISSPFTTPSLPIPNVLAAAAGTATLPAGSLIAGPNLHLDLLNITTYEVLEHGTFNINTDTSPVALPAPPEPDPAPAPSALRFRIRHVHKTIADHLEAELNILGWVAPPINFDTVPMTFLEFQPDEAGKAIVANTLAITLGDEPSADDEEMGDGLRSISYPVFVDVYGANQSIAASIASDVKALLEDCYLQVRDFTTDAAGIVTTEYIEIDKDDITVEKPAVQTGTSDFRRYWRVVRAVAKTHYVQD